MIDWPTVKTALHTWCRLATGLPGERVMWGGQGQSRPSASHLLLQIAGNQSGGQWTVQEGDAEVTLENVILRLQIESYAGTAQIADQYDSINALALIREQSSRLDIYRVLRAANVGVGQWAGIATAPDIINAAVFSLRASTDVQIFVTSRHTYSTGYFDSTEVNGAIYGAE